MPVKPVTSPSQSLSPSWKEPQWLIDNKNAFDEAFELDEKDYSILTNAFELKEEEYYSNTALHKTMGKLSECTRTLQKLREEKENIKRSLAEQKDQFEAQMLRFDAKTHHLQASNAKLITDLLQWKERAEKTKIENEAIDEKVKVINRKYKALIMLEDEEVKKEKEIRGYRRASTTQQLLDITNGLSEVLIKDGQKVNIVLDKEKNSYSIIYNSPTQLCGIVSVTNRDDLTLKTPAELKLIADNTFDADLLSKAEEYSKEWDAHVKAQEQFNSRTSLEGWPQIDAAAHKALHGSAVELAVQCQETAKKLKQDCTDFFSKIEENKRLFFAKLAEIHGENGEIENAIKEFVDAELNARGNNDADKQLVLVQKYDQLARVVPKAQNTCDSLREDHANNIDKFEQAKQLFGDYRSVNYVQYKLEAQAGILGIEVAIKAANTYLTSEMMVKGVENARKQLLLEPELKQLLGIALNHTDFWYHQIFLFSKKEIKNVRVPQGVCTLYNDLKMAEQNKYPVMNMLNTFRITVADRIKAGHGVIFKRTLNTTEVFYKAIHDLCLQGLNKDSFQEFKKKIVAIKDSDGRRLIPVVPKSVLVDDAAPVVVSPRKMQLS